MNEASKVTSIPRTEITRTHKRFLLLRFRGSALFRLRVGRINELVARRARARGEIFLNRREGGDRNGGQREGKRARNRSQSTRIIIANKVDVKGRGRGGLW